MSKPSVPVLVLGASGSGKSTSLRNFKPEDVLLIQAISKPLPFKSNNWKPLTAEGGSVYVCDNAAKICSIIQKTKRKVIIIDDFQYTMSNEFMRRSAEKGFDKFTEIGRSAWDIFTVAASAGDGKRIYILGHTQQRDDGSTTIKTIGKMLDEKVTLEGMVSVCLQTNIVNGVNLFATKNSGSNTVKTPIGMFDDDLIDNDLAAVDAAIVEYYGLETE